MNYQQKYLKYKNKYLEAKKFNQKGGVVIIPDSLKPLIFVKSDGSFDISDSVASFLSRWAGATSVNVDRQAIFQRYLPVITNLSYNIINLKGNGSCFYESMFLFLKMTNGEDFPFANYQDFKAVVISQIKENSELRSIHDAESYSELMRGIEHPDSPDIELPMVTISTFFGIKICSINTRMQGRNLTGYIGKYNDDGSPDLDCATIIVSEGHVYLVYPTTTDRNSSSKALRIQLYNSIV
jgi:hypothetical protein